MHHLPSKDKTAKFDIICKMIEWIFLAFYPVFITNGRRIVKYFSGIL